MALEDDEFVEGVGKKAEIEARVKETTGATLRCMPLDPGPFADLARPGTRVALFAKSY